MPDALGSIIRSTNQGTIGGRVTRYAGYGSVLYTQGGWSLPRNAWVGALGYRTTQMRHAKQYVRARHYATSAGGWITVDPVWPQQPAYGYVNGKPVSWTDGLGLEPIGCPDSMKTALNDACKTVSGLIVNDGKNPSFSKLSKCMSKKGHANPDTDLLNLLKCMAANCGNPPPPSPYKSSNPCVLCTGGSSGGANFPASCKGLLPDCSPGNPSVTLLTGNLIPTPTPRPLKQPPFYLYPDNNYTACGFIARPGEPSNATESQNDCMKDLQSALRSVGPLWQSVQTMGKTPVRPTFYMNSLTLVA